MKLLSDIQERIERSIFEAIRLLCVEQGYTPDITNFLDNETDTAAYKAELKKIKDEKGLAIAVFGVGNSQSKGAMTTPRFAMITRRFLPTDVGLPQSIQFIEDPQNPDMYLTQKLDSRFQFMIIEIQLVAGTAKEDRLLHQILGAALGSRGYLSFWDKPCDKFFLEQFSYWDNQNTEEGIMTKYYQYKIDNISIYDGEVDTLNKVAKIKQITVQTAIPENMPPATDLGNIAQDGDLVIP